MSDISTDQEIRLKCLALAVETLKNRQSQNPSQNVLDFAKKFEHYVINQKSVNLNRKKAR